MNKTGAGLAKWAEDIYAGGQHVYWYGTYCNPCTTSLLNGKTRQYSEHYTDKRRTTYEKHIQQGKTCTDCVGLIKGYYWELDGAIKYKRDGLPDKGAKGMYNAATIKGQITNGMPEIPGLLVWTKTQGHVGVYVGGGMVVEARGFSYGVQRNAVKKRGFTHWGLCPYIAYTAEEETLALEAMGKKVAADGTRPTLRKGDAGAAVKEMQEKLLAAGCKLEKYGADGSYGKETVEAVKAYQTANNLTPDGICGPLTWAKLDAIQGTTTGTTTAPTITTNRPTLRKGDSGPDVKEMQEKLLAAGCTLPNHGADGQYGAETVKAVKAYQTANSLTPDGICGPLTWAALAG